MYLAQCAQFAQHFNNKNRKTKMADRQISGGMSLPQWMKTKIGDQYDLDQAAFAPPVEDGSFFFIRYPRAMHQPDFGNLCNTVKATVADDNKANIPCQRFLAEIQAEGAMLTQQQQPLSTMVSSGMIGNSNKLNSTSSINPSSDVGYKMQDQQSSFMTPVTSKSSTLTSSKSTGSFQKSLVDVAHDVGGGLLGLGHHESSSSSSSAAITIAANNILTAADSHRHMLLPANYNFRHRRSSKSLPASPISSPNSSPKLRRKNPYFSDPFKQSNENFGKSGWLLSNILSQRSSVEDLSSLAAAATTTLNVTSTITTTTTTAVTTGEDSNVSESESPSVQRRATDDEKFKSRPTNKPSELREMNFWSPTSM